MSTSYGSITIVDITDIGEFSVYPKCNSPITVLYAPDSGNYTPNWQTSNLVITPVAYYAGNPISNSIQWRWTRQEGNDTPGAISSSNGEYVSDGTTAIGGQVYPTGTLVVNQNQFGSDTDYSQLTYIITATYPKSASSLGRDLVSEGQITFSKVEQGTSAKIARINGDNIIKYAGNGTIISPIDANQKSYITLNATVTGCRINGWKYDNNGVWTEYPAKENASPATYPSGTTGAVLNVYADDTTFSNDKVTIKLESSDANTYDEFTIYKLRDGAAGTSNLSALLTNDSQMIPARSDGTPIDLANSGATTQIKVFRGSAEVTASENWTIKAQASDNSITFTQTTTTQTNDTITVTGIGASVQAGNIVITASHSGDTDLIKTFSLAKVKAGADSRTYYLYDLNLNTLVLNLDIKNHFTPTSFTASATKTEVSTTAVTTSAFPGKFKITESYNNDSSDAIKYTSSTTESSKTYSPSAATVSKIKVDLLDAGGTNTLDTQTVVITADGATGQTGQTGPAGADAVSILLGNEAEVIACGSDNKPLSQTTIRIPFGAYKGTTRVTATVNSPQLFGISPTNTSATASADGSLVYEIPATTTISSVSGSITLVFSCEGQIFNKVFSWTRSSAAVNGTDGITMLLFTPQGTLFDNGTGELTVKGYLQEGTTEKTSDSTWTWYKWDSSSTPPGYAVLPTEETTGGVENPAYYTNQTLTAKAASVDGYGSFKVIATYNGKPYTQYISLLDKTDPLQISVHSTLGTQLVNGQGAGALYVRVTRDSVEIDPIGNTAITTGTSNPSGGNDGDHYIKLNGTDKTATLYYKDGTTWKIQPTTATYEWTFRDSSNVPLTSQALSAKFGDAYDSNTGKVTGKCLYLDKTTVDNKITADVKVTV